MWVLRKLFYSVFEMGLKKYMIDKLQFGKGNFPYDLHL